MDEPQMDIIRELMLDGNAAGGLFNEVFGTEMTAVPGECANCGNLAEMGAMLAFTQAPGLVLRCPVCEQVTLRVVTTEDYIYLDARGMSHIRMKRRSP